MMKDSNTAAGVSAPLQKAFDVLGTSLVQVNQNCTPTEAAYYRDKIGDVFYILVFHLLEPLYKEHPHLKPPDWDAQEHDLTVTDPTGLPKIGA